jgi:hypothetical protein
MHDDSNDLLTEYQNYVDLTFYFILPLWRLAVQLRWRCNPRNYKSYRGRCVYCGAWRVVRLGRKAPQL